MFQKKEKKKKMEKSLEKFKWNFENYVKPGGGLQCDPGQGG